MSLEPVECYIAKKIVDLVSSAYKPTKPDMFWEKFNDAYNLALLAAIAYGIKVGSAPEKLPLPATLKIVIDSDKEASLIKRRWWVIVRALAELSELCIRPL